MSKQQLVKRMLSKMLQHGGSSSLRKNMEVEVTQEINECTQSFQSFNCSHLMVRSTYTRFSRRSTSIVVALRSGRVKMSEEGLLVQVVRSLQFWKNRVMIVVCRWPAFVFGEPADSQLQEQVENRPHYITSDGESATSSGEKKWEEFTTVLTAKPSTRELVISNNIDPAGEFKVPLGLADEASQQPTDPAATKPSAQCQIPPRRTSLEDSKDHDIITAQRTPKPAVQDVKIGKEVLVINTRLVTVVKTKPDQIEYRTQDHVCSGYRVEKIYEDRFREFGEPELDNAAPDGLSLEAKPFKVPGHVPPSVSEGRVSTFAIHVDKTRTNLVHSLEFRRSPAGDSAEVLANLEYASPTHKSVPLKNDGSDSLGQGSSSRNFM